MELKAGAQLQNGKYRIIKCLGQGGFGITYLAEHEMMERKVCIKEFFLKEYCDRDEQTSQVSLGTSNNAALMAKYQEKFLKEARMIARMNHPNIIRIHDVFSENNTSYYVMDYIEGENLNDMVKRVGPLPEDKAIEYIKEVGSGLSYVHAQNINHLDVKPGNILVRGSDNQAVLIDFGLSKQYTEAGEQTSSTPIGVSAGYAPLEQYQVGGVSSFSPQTDVYSLAATLYRLVTGNVPPQASEVINEGLPDMPGVSLKVRQAIEEGMQFRKKDRPESVDDFLMMLGSDIQQVSSPIAEVTSANPMTRVSDESTVLITSEKTVVPQPSREEKSTVISTHVGHEFVDLGLPSGVKWATCNVGASKPEEVGDYFAWGETVSKKKFGWSNYKHCKGKGSSLIKYCSKHKYGAKATFGSMGYVDNKSVLDWDDDVACATWGQKWRLPSIEDVMEIRKLCSWQWSVINGMYGYTLTGPSKNSIFIPASGLREQNEASFLHVKGFYWLSSIDNSTPNLGRFLYFSKDGPDDGTAHRCLGLCVRPVMK